MRDCVNSVVIICGLSKLTIYCDALSSGLFLFEIILSVMLIIVITNTLFQIILSVMLVIVITNKLFLIILKSYANCRGYE